MIETIQKKLGLTPSAPANRGDLKQARREYDRSLGPLVEDLHGALDAKVETWRRKLVAQVADGVPEHPTDQRFWLIACLHAMIEAAPQFHAILDELAAEGRYDLTPKAEVEAKRAEFDRAELAIALAEEEAAVTTAEAEVAVLRQGLDARVQEALGK